jgi:hypothetical protein
MVAFFLEDRVFYVGHYDISWILLTHKDFESFVDVNEYIPIQN